MELENVVADLAQTVERRLYGKYRGIVKYNDDPKHLGRLRVTVPSVLGPEVVTGWAMPCVPYGGHGNQGFLCIPGLEAGVWVEFEEGNLEFPIWVGTFWSAPGGKSEWPKLNDATGAESPNEQRPPTRKILKTTKGHTIQFEDADDEEMVSLVEATHKHVVTLNKHGIHITDGVNGNTILMGKDGIQLGGSAATEPFVLGNQFMANVTDFLKALKAHTHPAPGGTATPSTTPMQLVVPLSAKHKVE